MPEARRKCAPLMLLLIFPLLRMLMPMPMPILRRLTAGKMNNHHLLEVYMNNIVKICSIIPETSRRIGVHVQVVSILNLRLRDLSMQKEHLEQDKLVRNGKIL
jgi:hypothetical protein